MSSAMHSPRRIRSAPSIALYELRLLRTSSRPGSLMRALEPRIRRWRGLARWHIHAYSSARGEIVLQLVAERQSHVARVDNLFVSWRKTLQRIFKLGAFKRGVWSSDALADVKLMHELSFDAAVAKLLAEADAVSSDVARCSYLEPALLSQSHSLMQTQQAGQPQLAPPIPPQLALLEGGKSGARVASTTQKHEHLHSLAAKRRAQTRMRRASFLCLLDGLDGRPSCTLAIMPSVINADGERETAKKYVGILFSFKRNNATRCKYILRSVGSALPGASLSTTLLPRSRGRTSGLCLLSRSTRQEALRSHIF